MSSFPQHYHGIDSVILFISIKNYRFEIYVTCWYTVHCETVHCEPVHCETVYCEPVHCEPVYCEPVHCEPVYCEPVHWPLVRETGGTEGSAGWRGEDRRGGTGRLLQPVGHCVLLLTAPGQWPRGTVTFTVKGETTEGSHQASRGDLTLNTIKHQSHMTLYEDGGTLRLT